MFSAGLLATAVTNYVGIGNLTSYRVRFTKQTWPGEMLSTTVAVTEKRPGNEIVLECALVNENGETKIQGEAVAVLPARADRWPAPRFDLPTPDIETQPFWDGCKEGKFLVRHCNACGEDHFYPRPFCPKCWSDDVAWKQASGRGDALHVLDRARRTTCRRSTSACRTSPRSSSSKRARG